MNLFECSTSNKDIKNINSYELEMQDPTSAEQLIVRKLSHKKT